MEISKKKVGKKLLLMLLALTMFLTMPQISAWAWTAKQQANVQGIKQVNAKTEKTVDTNSLEQNGWEGKLDYNWEGKGTSDNPYLISSADELAGLAEKINKDDSTYSKYSNKVYSLTKDINLNCSEEMQWIPIGNREHVFKGEFKGNGHKISGIYIDSNSDDLGFFGCITNAKIHDLIIEDSYIKGNNYIGSIVGYAVSSGSYAKLLIENCVNNATIEGNENIGGIIGYSNMVYQTKQGETRIRNCCNMGEIRGSDSVGGIVGTTYSDGDNVSERSFILQCYNSGNIVSENGKGGGITGYDYGINYVNSYISNCYNSGKVIGKDVGGIVGYSFKAGMTRGSSLALTNCYNIGEIHGEDILSDIIGGAHYSWGSGGNGVKINNSYYCSENFNDEFGNAYSDEEMKKKETYNTWDFESIWEQNIDYNGGYPYLQWAGYLIKGLNNNGIDNITTVSDNSIVVHIYDIGDGTKFAKAMKDATLDVDKFGSTSTNEWGKAVIENTLTDQPVVNTKISVTKEGYREYYFYKDIYNKDAQLLWNNNQQTIYMRKLQEGDESNPYVSTLMCQNSSGKTYDAMTVGENYHSMGSSQNVTLQMNAVWNEKTPSSYILYQENGISYTSEDGKFRLDMGEDFKARYPVYAKLVAADGTTVTEKTRIEIKGSSAPSSSGNSLNLINTDSTGTLGEDVAFLSGQNVSIKLGGAKLDVSVEAGKIRATIGKKNSDLSSNGEMFSNEEWEEWKKLCEHQPTDLNLSQWKNVIESIETDWTGSVKGDTDVYGYLEGMVNDAGSTVLTGKLKIKASVSASLQSQYMVGVVPVYAKVSIGADGGAEGNLTFNWTEKKMDAEKSDITLSLEPYLAAEGGLGVMAVATVGVEGKGSLPFSTKVGTNDATKLSLKGGLSFKVKLLAFEYSLKLAERELQLLPSEKSRSAARASGISELSMGDFELSDNHYMDEESIWLGDSGIQTLSLETTETGSVERVLKTNINPDADMQIVTAGNTKMILWTEGDPQRSSINSSKLVYSIYNAADDTWSAPEVVADDGTADFAPSVVSDGEHIYVAWQNIGKEFTDEADLSEVAAASTAVMSVWTAGEGFSEAVVVSEPDCMATTPKLALNAEGKPYIAYLQNTDNNLLITTGQNNIRYSVINGSNIEHKSFVENAGFVTAIDTSYTDAYEISYTLDKDNDLSTLEDREIIKKGTADAATQNNCMDSNVQYVKNGSNNLRFWYQDGSIIISDMSGNETVVYQDDTGALTDDFHVVSGQENQLAVIWTAVDADGNKQIEGSLYDPDKNAWSKSIQISDTDASVYNPQGIFTEDGSLQFLYKKTGETQTDLCVLMAEPYVNLAVENAYCDETSFVPGNKAKVSVQVKNNGSKSADGFVVDIEGTKTAVSENLAPGDSTVVEADYAVPADVSYQEIDIIAETGGDIDTTDNQFSLSVGHTDLAVNVTDSRLAFGQLVEVHAANQSCVDTRATLEVRKGNLEGELVKSIDLGTVAKGELVTATYLWNEDAENYSADTKTLYFNVVSEKQEKYTDNNYDLIAVGKTCTEHNWDEGIVTKTPTCTEKGEKEYTCTVCEEIKLEEIDATGHQNTEVRNKQDATCKTDGYSGDVYCKDCNVKIESGQVIAVTGIHTWDEGKKIKTPTCTEKGEKEYTCTICEKTKTEEIDATGHQNTEVRNKQDVTCKADGYSGDVYCKDCNVKIESGQVIAVTGIHTWDEGKAIKTPTCTEKGEKEYTCTVCGETKKEEIDKTSHTNVITIMKATTAKNGSISEKCTVCGDVRNSKTIFSVKSAVLKTSSYTYNGKAKKPSVTVKDSSGKAISNGNYTVAYKNNVKVGKATATIKLKGNYEGTIIKTFTICPKGTSVSGKIAAKSKGLIIKWKKQTKSTTGYQIQISTNKKFAKKTTVTKTVKKNSVTKLVVNRLKSKKKYYVRIRTYKTVKGKEYCSSWSKSKTVTTKK